MVDVVLIQQQRQREAPDAKQAISFRERMA